ncbi:hypothetical protein [Streptomyces sp. NPDC053541]|uniref:hypothetical protein n=1 Tax=Streptomyces sp. NPDC053541 TaxID=3365709 RepID=UPI0037CF870D
MTVGERVRRAVVMGGSYAGLFAARVLSEWADEVVVLEADDIGADGTGRLAPQRRQLHALLAMGHAQLERWFPGSRRSWWRPGPGSARARTCGSTWTAG